MSFNFALEAPSCLSDITVPVIELKSVNAFRNIVVNEIVTNNKCNWTTRIQFIILLRSKFHLVFHLVEVLLIRNLGRYIFSDFDGLISN